jgi:DNA/RNA endonuclease G (NUC1)
MTLRPVRCGSTVARPTVALAAFATLLAGCAGAERALAPEPSIGGPRFNTAAALPAVRISEIHYDNASTDVNERVEVSFPTGTDLSTYSIVLYNGSGGVTYGTRALAGNPVTSCGDRSVVVLSYPSNGIQNGSPDGLALVNGTEVVEFLSYEGTFAATNGPANGLTSTDIGVAQAGTESADASLRRGSPAGEWAATLPAGTNTFGACNDQGGGGPEVGPLASLTVTGATSVDVAATVTLTAVAEDAEGDDITAGTVTWSDGDSPNVTVTPNATGRSATVRGDLAGGPVAVIASITENGVTRADTVTVTVTTPRPPGATARISFSGFNTAPLPVGYEDQVFATPRDAAGAVVATPITWRSVTPELATIDATTGVHRALAPGRALFEAATGDGFLDTAFVITGEIAPATTAVYGNHLEFGRPTDATPGDDFLVQWAQFVSSYNRTRGQPNWIAYNLEATHRGPAERCDCFTHDPSLPADFPVLTTNDYVGSGYSRGHMTMSEDRTAGGSATTTSVDNARTFYFTNIVPQTSQNNGGPWLGLEIALGDSASKSNREVYVVAGGAAYSGTLNGAGKVAIPTVTWKVAVIMPRDRGLADFRTPADAQVIAVVMPNTTTIPQNQADWPKYVVTVDSVEALTGYDLLSALPDPLERVVESGRTPQAPTAVIAGPTAGDEGATLQFDARGSTDPDVGGPLADALSYAWAVNGVDAGVGPTLGRTFADNGTFAVRLIAADQYGLADTTTTTVTIANVAPAVAPFAGATLYQGETFTRTVTFADPGADSFTAQVSWGDGTAGSVAISDTSIALSHLYTKAGANVVTVTVTDDDAGAGSASATVQVRTPLQGIDDLAALVNAFPLTATFNHGERNALLSKLEAAGRALERGNATPAVNVLDAFANQIRALVGNGSLSAAQGDQALSLATRVSRSAARSVAR